MLKIILIKRFNLYKLKFKLKLRYTEFPKTSVKKKFYCFKFYKRKN